MTKIYPESHVEIQGITARKYDKIMDMMSFGLYSWFIESAVEAMYIEPGERILDLGCGTGRNACLMHDYFGDTGYYLGLDISEEMGGQFREKCKSLKNVEFKIQRADLPFIEEELFDTVFMSFVLHGFPPDVRMKVLQNIFDNLKPGGRFCLLDFSQFKLREMPFHYRFLFKTFECKYAFDFVERDWKQIFTDSGFGNFQEFFWFKKYVRLLIAIKE